MGETAEAAGKGRDNMAMALIEQDGRVCKDGTGQHRGLHGRDGTAGVSSGLHGWHGTAGVSMGGTGRHCRGFDGKGGGGSGKKNS
jgi:hypothetical protein